MSNRTDDGQRPDDYEREVRDDDRLPAPRPDRSPEDVLKTVLTALETNDDPVEDAGIRTAFAFASPAYRNTVGGSLQAFYDHMHGPIHRTLVDHSGTKRGRLAQEGDHATEKVVVVDGDGTETTYEFSLSVATAGENEGCWTVDEIELVYVGASPDHRHMPVVEFDGVEVKCSEGEVLRDVLLEASGVSPHDEATQYANCNGKGLCGTCAVEVEGEVTEKTAQEKRRLRLPPHDEIDDPNFRLSCQCRVLGDLDVRKHDGIWGEHVEEYDASDRDDDGVDTVGLERPSLPESVGDDGDGDGTSLSDETESLLDEADDVIDDG